MVEGTKSPKAEEHDSTTIRDYQQRREIGDRNNKETQKMRK